MSLRVPLSLLLLTLPVAAVAQTHFCIGGDLDRMSSPQVSACQAKMSAVRQAVKQRGAPAGWHFVVVCDEAGWQTVAAMASSNRAALRTADFHTDTELHWTFVRGTRMAPAGAGADLVLASALDSVPAVQPLPNPKRMPAPATLVLAETHTPQPQPGGGGDSYSR